MSQDEPPDNGIPGNGMNEEMADSPLASRRFSARDEDFQGANDEALAIMLAHLEEEHRDLDAAIRAIEETSPYERLTIARLKKKKLQLKDEIEELKDAMMPDIIA